MRSIVRIGILVVLVLALAPGTVQGTGYHDGPDDCLPEVRYDDPSLDAEEFSITADIEIIDSPDVFRVTHTVSAGESVENYTLKTREQGILFEIVETNMTPLSDGERYRGEGTSTITTEVNTTDSTLEWFWESKNYSAFETKALETFNLTIVTDTATYNRENAFEYMEFDPPAGYPGVEMYDAEMVTFGDPQHVFNYSTPDGSFTLVSDRSEEFDLTYGLNYSQVRKHLTEDLNLTTDKRHRALYLVPPENATGSAASGCNGRVNGQQDAIVHEYIHLRQHDSLFDPDRLWMIEGGARYFDSRITHHENIGGKRSLPVYFMELAHYPEMNLTDPDTWPNLAEYTKGGRAFNWMAYLGVDVQDLFRESYREGFDNDALEAYLRENARKDPSRLITELENASLMPRYIYGDRFLNEQGELLVRNDTRHTQFVSDSGLGNVYYNIEEPVEELPTGDLSMQANDTTIKVDLDAVGTGVDVYVTPDAPVQSFSAMQTPKPLYYDVTVDGEPVEYYFGKPDSADPAFGRFDSMFAVPDLNLSEPATLRFEYNETAALAVTNPDYEGDPVDASPVYELTNLSVPDSAVVGERIEGSVEITNTGDVAGPGNLTVTVQGETQLVNETVTLGTGESVVRTFTYEVPESTDELAVGVVAGESGDEATVEVLQPPSFGIELTNVPADVEPGEEIEVGYAVVNTGERAGSLNISLHRDGQVVAMEEGLQVSGNGSAFGTFSVEVVPDDVPAITLTLEGGKETVTREVSVSPADHNGSDGSGSVTTTDPATDRIDSQETPGFGLLAGLFALAGLLWTARRRRM